MSEVKIQKVFQNADLRLEAEFYTKNNFDIKGCLGKEIIDFVQYGTSEELNEEGEGYPILRLNEFDNYFIAKPSKYCSKISEQTYESLKLRRGDVLICRTNGNPKYVGKSAIVMKDVEYAFASYLFRIRPNDKINAETLVAYLNGFFGRTEIEKYSMQSNQSNFSPAKFREIKIPILGNDIQKEVKKHFENSYNASNLSQQKYTQAENLLLETLNLKDFQPKSDAANIKTLKESFLQTGRLDAEFYQKKYEEIEQKIQNYIEGYAPLGKVCTLKDTNFTPNDNTEYAYIELSNIGNSGEITGCTREMGINLPTRARRKVSENDVIVSSIEGSLKSCAIISKEYHNALCSTGFYVVASEQINAETLLILFKSELMQQILKKNCSGTILTAINKEEFLNIPIPIIGKKYQEQIAEYIQKANQLRTEAQSLLQEAKLSVESAIESQLTENQNISGGG